MSVSLSRRRQSPWHGFWEGGRENEQANAGQPGFAETPALRKRRSRRRLPCQPAPPPRPNRHPPPCPPGQSAVSKQRQPRLLYYARTRPKPPRTHPHTPNQKTHVQQPARPRPRMRTPSCLSQHQRHHRARVCPAPPPRCQQTSATVTRPKDPAPPPAQKAAILANHKPGRGGWARKRRMNDLSKMK